MRFLLSLSSILPSVLNVIVMKFNQAPVNGGSINDSLKVDKGLVMDGFTRLLLSLSTNWRNPNQRNGIRCQSKDRPTFKKWAEFRRLAWPTCQKWAEFTKKTSKVGRVQNWGPQKSGPSSEIGHLIKSGPSSV